MIIFLGCRIGWLVGLAGLDTWFGFTFGWLGDLVGLGWFAALVGFAGMGLRFGWVQFCLLYCRLGGLGSTFWLGWRFGWE